MYRTVIIMVIAIFAISGCVTVNTSTVRSMSSNRLCELVGPKWWNTPGENRTLRSEIRSRNLTCRNGYVVRYAGSNSSQQPATPTRKRGGYGTGIVVTKSGYIVTSYHVVASCANIYVVKKRKKVRAKRVYFDAKKDLAILKSSRKMKDIASFTRRDSVRQGAEVVVLGYPLATALGTDAKITNGIVNSLSGLRNKHDMQISAPVQPGNSGGPVLNLAGNVVGIVKSRLSTAIGQNVNFAVKASVLKKYLDQKNISYDTSWINMEKDKADIYEKATKFILPVLCQR